ncbi:cupin domain-containing protein [Pseudoalteromonas mariniglutinosa]|uniref:AraC family transcriptional regulator n=1 Tax=Pseudoalteromonas mariniglutinosa TaxID=206042 RepID=UPI003850A464
MDRLSTLLAQFGMHATTFYAGTFAGELAFDAEERSGKLYLFNTSKARVHVKQQEMVINQPSLLFIPRPGKHSITAAASDNTQLVSAAVSFDGGLDNPLTTALPDYMLLPISELPILSDSVLWLFSEATEQNCGKNAVLNRLFELIMIQLLRHVMASSSFSSGMMAGLADLRLARAVTLMHDQPAKTWSVAELAGAASMSRASFAAQFHKIVGKTPADYLLSWRVSLTQKRLREGRPIALIADEVGYESPSALARAFRRKTGASPREWLRQQ